MCAAGLAVASLLAVSIENVSMTCLPRSRELTQRERLLSLDQPRETSHEFVIGQSHPGGTGMGDGQRCQWFNMEGIPLSLGG